MGLLDRFILPDHRLAAVKIKDYSTSLKSTDTEQRLATTLGVELHRFISERNVLLIGFTRSTLSHYASQSDKTTIALTYHFTDIALKEYFSTRPGMAATEGLAILEKACQNYYLEEPVQVGDKFLFNLTNGKLDSESLEQYPQLQQYVQSLLREALLLVHNLLSKV